LLDDCDWDAVTTVRDSGNVRIYEFDRAGKTIWVAWNDGQQEEQATIEGVSSDEVAITKMIPEHESGLDITAFESAFEKTTQSTSDGQVTLTVGENPLIVVEN